MEMKDFKDAVYYMITKKLVPREDTERISRAADVIGLTGLTAIIGGTIVALAISMGPKEAFKTFNYGVNAAASLEYGGNINK